MLSGCAENKLPAEETAVSDTQISSVSVPAVTDINIPVHDIDPLAEEKGAAGLPYFISSQCEEISFYPSEDAVKRMGRFIEYNDTLYLSYTCSAISFSMTGDRAEAVITSNGSVYADNQQAWIAVLLNGELINRIKLEAGDNSYVLYEGEELENAEISVVKLTENQMATVGIKSITANASRIAPRPPKDKKIEFIGDSITCGYGNEADDPSDGYDSAQQNGLKTYGYYTAQILDADYSFVSISGLGLISDYTDYVGVKEDYLLMPEVYDYSDTNFQMRRGITELTPWDFGTGSDIVVINMGTNDYSYTGKREELQDEFEEAYYEFLGDVREHNPNADIVCTMGIMGAQLLERIENAAARFSKDYNDNRIYTMKFDYQDEADGYGGDYHPSAATHKKAAQQLAEFLINIEKARDDEVTH